MTKEDYSKYYIQGSDHYLIPKYEFIELFNEMSNWKQDIQKYKEELKNKDNIIDELEKWLEENKKISQAHENVLGVNISNLVLDKLKELKEVE